MRSILIVILCSALAGLSMGPASAATAQKSAKECRAEWRANKADNVAKGVSEKAYVKQCRAGGDTAAAPTQAAPATQATRPVAAPAAAPVPSAKSPSGTSAMTKARATPSGANQFADEGQAKARCPSGTVVWANLKSKVYHFSGTKSYGNTKSGAYMCETDATADGFRAAKNEKHPT